MDNIIGHKQYTLDSIESIKSNIPNTGEWFSKIPYSAMKKIECRGVHILFAAWLIFFLRGLPITEKQWFSIDPDVPEFFGVPRKSWYGAMDLLEEYGVIEMKRRAGKYGRNLYRVKEENRQ